MAKTGTGGKDSYTLPVGRSVEWLVNSPPYRSQVPLSVVQLGPAGGPGNYWAFYMRTHEYDSYALRGRVVSKLRPISTRA